MSLVETIETAAGQSYAVRGTGVEDFSGHTGELTMSIPDLPGSMEIRLIAPEMYLKLPPALAAHIPGGKTWVSMNLNAIARAQLGASFSELTSSSQWPTETLSYLQATSTGGVKAVGSQTLDGVTTTKYVAIVDLNKVAADSSVAGRKAVQKIEAELHTATLPVDVWIDGNRRVRRLSFAVKARAGSSGSPTSTSIALAMEFSNFGAPVNVSRPPAADTYNITSQPSGTTGG